MRIKWPFQKVDTVTISDSNENNYVYNISPAEQLWLGLTDQNMKEIGSGSQENPCI